MFKKLFTFLLLITAVFTLQFATQSVNAQYYPPCGYNCTVSDINRGCASGSCIDTCGKRCGKISTITVVKSTDRLDGELQSFTPASYYDDGSPETCKAPTSCSATQYNCGPKDCAKYDADLGTTNGCKVPTEYNVSCFDTQSPQVAGGYMNQSCDNMKRTNGGGCGGTNGCDQGTCSNELTGKDTCKKDRDGTYKCGGKTACGESGVCENDYVTTPTWGTNEGVNNLGWSTGKYGNSNSSQLQETYPFSDLTDPKKAHLICGTTGEMTRGNSQILCRCGQVDACGKNTASKADLEAHPADLKITALFLEEYIGLEETNYNSWVKYANALINTPEQHRLVVSFEPVENAKDSEILYTRLIEVCPINIGNEQWNLAHSNDLCVIRRVDGDESLIKKPFSIPIDVEIPRITQTPTSQGPWSVRFRVINDVCNRTFGDNTLASRGDQKACRSTTGSKNTCINVPDNMSSLACETGKFFGIYAKGNSDAASAYGTNSGSTNDMNYCKVVTQATAVADDKADIIEGNRHGSYSEGEGESDAIDAVRDEYSGEVGGYDDVIDYTKDNQSIDEFVRN